MFVFMLVNYVFVCVRVYILLSRTMLPSLVAAILLLHSAFAVPLSKDDITPRPGETCGYDSCPKADPDVLNIHIVAHTHDDVGWLKTVDQYYYGSRNNIQKAGVQYIIDSVIQSLWEDPKRRFIYVETSFLWKWWQRQSEETKGKVHTLVRQGRLEFIGGAWSMNDEAAVHYQSTIDQFTFGLRILNETFGDCGRPRVGWQIDPFGHAREFANLLAGMNYDGLFLGRIDYQDKRTRLESKTMEMVWRGDDDLGKHSDIFTGVLYNMYQPPSGFCFDILCSDEPIVDDKNSPMYNVDERIEDFLKQMSAMAEGYATKNVLITMGEDFHYQDANMWFTNLDKLVNSAVPKHGEISGFLNFCTEQAKGYKTNNVILTMGGDFTFMDAAMWYQNLDKLIEYSNMKAAKEGLKIKMFYSTPSCYLKAIKDSNPTLPTKQDDFFPYGSDPTAYWTGYFTSRPTTKFFERQGNNYLQGVKQMQVLSNLEEHNKFALHELSEAMGIMQHHDAITGTEKEHVTHDYERILTSAIDDALIIARQAFNKISQGDANKTPLLSYDRCMFNQSQCATSEDSEKFVLTIYNPLAWEVAAPIRVPVVKAHYTVYGPGGGEILTQITKLSPQVLNIPTRQSKATHELVFIAEHLPALGFKQFYVEQHNVARRSASERELDVYFINDYWKNIKDQTYIDIKHLESEDNDVLKNKFKEFEISTERLKTFINTNNEKSLESGLEMLKDNKDGGFNDDIVELERMMKEIREKYSELDVELAKAGRESVAKDERVDYPLLNDEEMRMLSDDPAVIEQYNDGIENEHYKLSFDEENGDVTRVTMGDGTEFSLSCSLVYYRGCVGDNTQPDRRSSGAYIFRPNGTKAEPFNKVGLPKVTRGPVYDSVHYEFEQGTLEFTLYKHPKMEDIQLTWTAAIDISDGFGKEVAVLYESKIINNGEFYTDSNGRQMIKRKLNQRAQYNVTLEEPIPGNYYPVVNKITINDNKHRFAVITDRSQGGSSLAEGQIELMVHRRLLRDDAFGVGEALNETANDKPLHVRGQHYLFLKPISKTSIIKERVYTLQHHLEPQIYVSKAEHLNRDQWRTLRNEYTGLKKLLPEGLHLLTLEPWRDGTLLIRFENYFEKADRDKTNVEVDISDLFTGLKLVRIEETNLAGNQWLKDNDKWLWETENEFSSRFNDEYGSFTAVPKAKDDMTASRDASDFKIELAAKQIRTFVVKYEFV